MKKEALAFKCKLLTLLVFFLFSIGSPLEGQEPRFIRGDSNSDGIVDIADPLFSLAYLFGQGPSPVCMDAADANDDGKIDISDAIATLDFLFAGGTLPAPNPLPGYDQTPDNLDCKGGIKKQVPFEQISIPCIDMVSLGASFQAVVRSQEEYADLIYELF